MENNSTFSHYEFGSTYTPYLDTYIDRFLDSKNGKITSYTRIIISFCTCNVHQIHIRRCLLLKGLLKRCSNMPYYHSV